MITDNPSRREMGGMWIPGNSMASSLQGEVPAKELDEVVSHRRWTMPEDQHWKWSSDLHTQHGAMHTFSHINRQAIAHTHIRTHPFL